MRRCHLLLCDKLKCLSLNCCSLRSSSKKARLLALIDELDPDIICGCESHLSQSYHSSEIFPDSYMVLRKDRIEGAGGVFVCIKKHFNVSEERELDADAELIWAKIMLLNIRPIYLCSFYRPPDSNLNLILQLQCSLN